MVGVCSCSYSCEVYPIVVGSKGQHACTIEIMAPDERLGIGRAADEKLKICK